MNETFEMRMKSAARLLIATTKFDEIVKRKHQREELGQIKLIVTEKRFAKGSVTKFELKKSTATQRYDGKYIAIACLLAKSTKDSDGVNF